MPFLFYLPSVFAYLPTYLAPLNFEMGADMICRDASGLLFSFFFLSVGSFR